MKISLPAAGDRSHLVGSRRGHLLSGHLDLNSNCCFGARKAGETLESRVM